MEVQDHIATANEFLEAADREFAAGDQLQGSEKLWGGGGPRTAVSGYGEGMARP